MIPFRRLLPSLIALLMVASCSDSTGPVSQAPDLEMPEVNAAFATGWGDPTLTPAAHVLRQSPEAPPLTDYQVSFWAVKGQSRTINVYYEPEFLGGGRYIFADLFLQFDVPRRALATRPDGSSIAKGDSVLITLTIDPVELRVEFEPKGLQFNAKSQPTLEMWYGNADPDADRDGDVDEADHAVFNDLSFFHYQHRGSRWHKVKSDVVDGTQKISASVPHFSGFAVSW